MSVSWSRWSCKSQDKEIINQQRAILFVQDCTGDQRGDMGYGLIRAEA